MLRESLEYLLTPCPRHIRALGYLSESVALGARYRRQSRVWTPHVAACRRFILDAADRVPADGRLLVAGAGRLIELPLHELSGRFAETVLADVVHPLPVRLAAWRVPGVRLWSLDVAGVLGPLHAALTAGGPLPVPPPDGLFDGPPFDLVISCNLLSQLPLLPLDAIEARLPVIDEASRHVFAQALVRAHLRWMRRAGRAAALFTDLESVWLDRAGRAVERDSSLWDIPLPPPDRAWEWDIAPAGEQDRDLALRHRVGAWFEVPNA